ncbi:MAG TPA: ABC transporter permease, partial [Cyclobacteriaceae bacterium]|nr:ABC transporter permease [Cyclobacteriaceae bacterium]
FQGYTFLNDKISHGQAMADEVHFTIAGINIDKILGFNLIAGRWFDHSEASGDKSVVVINQSLKEKLFGDENAVGKNIIYKDQNYRVIGVTDHYKYQGEFSRSVDIIFSPFWFKNANIRSWGKPKTDFIKVISGTSIAEINNLTREISLRFPDYKIEITPLTSDRTQYIRRIWGPVTAVFIVFTFVLLIVLLGQFGVLWYNISQRKTEIGIRRAIGANKSKIFIMILREMSLWASAGIILGAIIFSQAPILKLYPVDLNIFINSILISAVVIYILVTLCSLIPGIQATKIRPAAALHEE